MTRCVGTSIREAVGMEGEVGIQRAHQISCLALAAKILAPPDGCRDWSVGRDQDGRTAVSDATTVSTL